MNCDLGTDENNDICTLCRIRSQKAEFVDTMKQVWVGAFDGESGKELKLKIVE